jgi:hypothetical protein
MLTAWASAQLRGINPPENIQNGGRPGDNASQSALAIGSWRQHFDDES